MALAYLLEENLSFVIANQVRVKRQDIQIHSVYFWRDCAFLGQKDERLLRAAAEDGLTLVTYDQSTIPELLSEWGVTGEEHGGVLFVDEQTIREGDVGGMVLALIDHWDLKNTRNWINVIDFLRAARRG